MTLDVDTTAAPEAAPPPVRPVAQTATPVAPAAPGPGHYRRVPHRAILAPVVLLLVATAIGLWWLVRQPAGAGPLIASGTIEVEEVTLAAEASGRIAELLVDEGSQVLEGQIVGGLTDPVLEVQLKQAAADAAQQQVAQAQMRRLELRAPLGGTVQKRIAHKGEFVASGAPVITVADPSNLKLTLFVLEADLGRVAVGQVVAIRSDAFAERVFAGRVKTIATKAEFTPRNVQTQKDRQNLVFAVTVAVPNADGALKSGLPVDATFE
jgi:multidrug resistance efflux pump